MTTLKSVPRCDRRDGHPQPVAHPVAAADQAGDGPRAALEQAEEGDSRPPCPFA